MSETVLDGATVPVDPFDSRVFKVDWDALANLDTGVSIASSRFEVIGIKPSPVAIASITRSGAVMTVTTTAAHGLTTGAIVTIAGADQADYNVSGDITVTSTLAFTLAVSGAPATPATGSLSYSQGLTLDNASILSSAPYDSRVTQVRLTGKGRSYAGRRYEIANRITTYESPAQTKERSFFVVIENQ